MRLRDFYRAVAPALVGAGTPGDSARALGIPETGVALYAGFCDFHRREVLDGIFRLSPRAVSEEAYAALGRAYFDAHPCVHWDLNANAEAFPGFLASRADVPAWMAELADLEWWRFRTFAAPDEKARARKKDALHPVAMVRGYAHDVVTALREERVMPAPEARPTVALLWRDDDGEEHVRHAEPADLVVIKATVERVPREKALAASGLKARAFDGARRRLVRDGFMVAGTGAG